MIKIVIKLIFSFEPLSEPSGKGYQKLTREIIDRGFWIGKVPKPWKSGDMPENVFFNIALMLWECRHEAARLDGLTTVRNGLPFIHGRMSTGSDPRFKHAELQHVNELAEMLLAFVNKLDNPQSHSPAST